MRLITFGDIAGLGVSGRTCCAWVEQALALKGGAALPKKISLKPDGMANVFYNTMPCLIPQIARGGGQASHPLSGTRARPR